MSSAADPRLVQEPPLAEFTEQTSRARCISWYRTPIPSDELKRLYARSDVLAALQTLGYLAVLVIFGGAAVWAVGRLPGWAVAAFVFAYGTCASFLINGVHELGHGTVFRTKWLNGFFCHVLAFLGSINHEMFQHSHVRHHRYTLHPPDDLEVRLPVQLAIRDYLKAAFFNWAGLRGTIDGTLKVARGRIEGEWNETLFPASDTARRRAPIRWARVLVAGHAVILVVSLATGCYLVPVLVTLGPHIGNWLFWLCNNTQHVGLQDDVADFRLCCRTFLLNPVARFLYWQMNYHTEHHMYAAVPCYRLGRLHRLIRHDLPPTPRGLVAVWREIGAIMLRQQRDPSYRHAPELPAAL